MATSPFGVEHGELSKGAGSTAEHLATGFQQGRRLANEGHAPLGPLGSGVAGRKTYSVAHGTPTAQRVGVHLGVVGAQAPMLGAAAVTGGVLASRRKKVAKRDVFGLEHRDRNVATASGVAGATAGGSGAVLARHLAARKAEDDRRLIPVARRAAAGRSMRNAAKIGVIGAASAAAVAASHNPRLAAKANELRAGRHTARQVKAFRRQMRDL